MKKLIAFLFSALLPVMAVAAGGPAIPLDEHRTDLHDTASLQRGWAAFKNYCLSCHSANYQRYERAAQDLGVPADIVEQNLLLPGHKIGEQMTIAMRAEDAKAWFGAPPPDLTLEARLRGADWLYTYLRAFYVDESRPFGVNNTVFPNVGMPHVLMELQGIPEKTCKPVAVKDENGNTKVDPLTGKAFEETQCDVIGIRPETAKMTTAEYDQFVYDLVNFMVYIGEPSKLESQRLGTYVLIFLAIFFVFAYALKREYWRDVH
ncbi:cytochrome c1 [Balneatrix alpica]|uniref:Cytochrome c1 n=2 Tax=Balneatrix alpica TaxID=75684 RepID=A0ABV5ZC93_9GAMM|nr:cytochrome c1 [Balneatrix alpica]